MQIILLVNKTKAFKLQEHIWGVTFEKDLRFRTLINPNVKNKTQNPLKILK